MEVKGTKNWADSVSKGLSDFIDKDGRYSVKEVSRYLHLCAAQPASLTAETEKFLADTAHMVVRDSETIIEIIGSSTVSDEAKVQCALSHLLLVEIAGSIIDILNGDIEFSGCYNIWASSLSAVKEMGRLV